MPDDIIDFVVKSSPNIDYVINDLMSSDPCYGLIIGKSGRGKTNLMLNMAGGLSTGTKTIDMDMKRRKVLYLAFEGGQRNLQERAFKIIQRVGVPEPGFFQIELIGPFLLDVDRFITPKTSFLPDLELALKDTRRLIQDYCSELKDSDYRIFFTGHKGFNFEIRPTAIGVQPHTDRRSYFEKRRREINNYFGNGFVDPFHKHIRLHNSINVWIDYSGRLVRRMKYEITPTELDSLSIDEICIQSERLAADYLELY